MTLINEDYKRQLQEMHATNKKFIRSGEKKLKLIETFQNKYQQKLQHSRDSKNDFDTKIDIQ